MRIVALFFFVGTIVLGRSAVAEDFIWPDADAWSEPLTTGSTPVRNTGAQPASSVDGRPVPNDVRVGNNSVRFGTIAGTPGAHIDRDGSPVTIGVAVAPAFVDAADGASGPGLSDLDTDLTGALEFSLQSGSAAPRVSVSGPITGDGRGGSQGAFRTMFGMDYKF